MRNHVLSLVLALSAIQASYSQHMDVEKILVEYVSPGILTIYEINCDDFEQFFRGKLMKKKILDDTLLIKKIEDVFKTIKYKKGNNQIDVRKKFVFYLKNGNPSIIVCMNRFYDILIDNRNVARNEKFIYLLKSIQ